MNRCANCPGINPCVPSDGPDGCDILLIGEAPGKEENKKGKVFIGKTGEELNRHYLPLINRRRESVKIINAISCLPPGPDGKLDPKRAVDIEMLNSCAREHLYPYIRKYRPRTIVPMGAFATRAIDPNVDLDLQHGIPITTEWGNTFPMYHPAGGIHEPKKMLHIRNDWVRLSKYLRGKLRIPVDEYDGMEDYRHLQHVEEIDEVLAGYEDNPLACDTETTKQRDPFCLTFTANEGTGYLIKADDFRLLSHFQSYLDRWRGLFLFHNWRFDGGVVKRMGLNFRWKRVRDTMVKVFHLGNLPQGLKALAYRELGMRMQDFDDLVSPYSREIVLDYYREAFTEDWGKPDEELIRDPKSAKLKVKKPQGFNTKLKRFFTDLSKNSSKDVFGMWTKNWEDLHEMVETRLGPWPGKCITHAPFEEVIRYACRDSDATYRLWPVIKRMERNVRRTVQENWSDFEFKPNRRAA